MLRSEARRLVSIRVSHRRRELTDASDWLPMYDAILKEFGFSKEEDIKAAELLSNLLGYRGGYALSRLREELPKSVLICGGSPTLADEVSSLTADRYVVAADSAASVLLDAGFTVNMVVTDLDGVVEDQIELNRRGAWVFVHAHGDNQAAIRKYVPLIPDRNRLVGTCQCELPERSGWSVYNFGGFTDGDRAACICVELGARWLYLAGFDFENPAEKPGKNRDVKMRKLAWAKRILQKLGEQGVRILDASTERSIF